MIGKAAQTGIAAGAIRGSNHCGAHIASFEDVEHFKSRVDAAIQQIHDYQLAPGFDRVYAPGELEAIRRVEYREKGIPLNRVTLANVRETAERLGIDVNTYEWL